MLRIPRRILQRPVGLRVSPSHTEVGRVGQGAYSFAASTVSASAGSNLICFPTFQRCTRTRMSPPATLDEHFRINSSFTSGERGGIMRTLLHAHSWISRLLAGATLV